VGGFDLVRIEVDTCIEQRARQFLDAAALMMKRPTAWAKICMETVDMDPFSG
jgi:hypothetical protein